MTKKLDKLNLVKGQKWERKDPIENLGIPTPELIKDAIKEGKNELAKDLVDYYYFWETKFVRDTNVDLVGGFPSYWMENYGEDNIYDVYKTLLSRAMGRREPRPPKRHDAPPVDELATPFDYAVHHALMMVRPHRMGKMDGTEGFVINEYEDRWEILWDPCYTGGRMRRGDPISGAPPYTSAPYNYYVTKVPHTWTAGKVGLTGYCIHCYIMHALQDIEATGGYLGQWVVAYPENPWDPCPYIAYKDIDWIPEKYYTQLGKVKPKVTSPNPVPKNSKLMRTIHSHNLGPFWRIKDGEQWIHVVPRIKTAIDNGDKAKATKLVDTMWAETANHHSWYPLTWNWQWIDFIVENYGYNELYHALRSIYSPMEPPLVAKDVKLTKDDIPGALERAQKAAAWGRGDMSGPEQEGSVKMIDEKDRIVMELNPCGSGGRAIMKIDKVDDIRRAAGKEVFATERMLLRNPMTEPPFSMGVTKEAHPVCWNKVGIPSICTRCCVHFEIDAYTRTGYLTTVIDRPANATDPSCRWYFYKELDDVPEKYYNEIGAVKPKPQK
jgi:hypothetical protein